MKTSTVAALAAIGKAGAAPSASPATCCEILSQVLPNNYYSPSTAEYNSLVSSRWSKTAILHPGCVITPSSASQVAEALVVLEAGQCQFSVKSGGHNANPGANSINGGISIDLARLNSTSLSADRSYVTLGTGITWGHAYAAFEKQGIAFTGGICEDVGVGGLSVGGGQSLFQAGKGWVVDNILRYEIVLASGKIANVTQKSHPDLFKALKGGSTNFGIVTGIDLAAFDFSGLWGGVALYNITGPGSTREQMVEDITKATTDFINKSTDLDTGIQAIVSRFRNQAEVLELAVSNVANVANPPALHDFEALPNKLLDTSRHTSLADLAHETSVAVPKGFRYLTASVTIDSDYDTLLDVWKFSDATYEAIPAKDKVDWMVSFVPQPVVQELHAAKSGGNSLGLQDVKKNQIVLWLLSRWDDASLDGMMNAARQKFVDGAAAIAKDKGTYSPFVYVNYAGPNQQPLCGYGQENVEALRKAARKYDPSGVFQRLMPGGFKISQAQC